MIPCCGEDSRHGFSGCASHGLLGLRASAARGLELGPDGLKDSWANGSVRRLSPAQLSEFATIVETAPDHAVHGVVRWRRVDLKRVIGERFGVAYHERTIGKLLKQIGFSHVSARPRHPGQKAEIIKAFKKTSRRR